MVPTLNTEELEQRGWKRRFTIEKDRAIECVENYEVLGFEVVIIPTRITHSYQACSKCFRSDTCNLVTIYTRPKEEKGKETASS